MVECVVPKHTHSYQLHGFEAFTVKPTQPGPRFLANQTTSSEQKNWSLFNSS